jgi:tRNA(Ile)-lysidine synthase
MERVHLAVSAFLQGQGIGRREPILVAVSGGADSCTLMHVLAALGQRIGVAHVHHGLRAESADADLEFVRERARALGLPFFAVRVNARERDGRSPEARARALRYAALERLRLRSGYNYVATAHTLDDQAETVLLRAIRGTAAAGLAGTVARRPDGRVLRPLLEVRRELLREYLRQRGLSWREDPSNQNLAIPRNRIRAEVMPVLESIHPAAARKLADLAESASATAAWMAESTAPALEQALLEGDGGLWIDPGPLVALGPPLRMRALAELLRRGGLAERVSRTHLERVARFIEGAQSGKTLSLPQDMTLLCDQDRFWLGPASGPRFPPDFSASLRPPDALELPQRGLRLTWYRPGASCKPGLRVAARLASPLVVRSPLPGDSMRALKRAQSVPLTDLFASARWSRRDRARAVVVELDKQVLWVPGLGSACAERTPSDTRESLDRTSERDWVLVCEPLSPCRESC